MAIEVQKKKAGIALQKRGISNIVAEVYAYMDASGSMQRLYSNGTVESIMERILAVALQFDDNGVLDAAVFHDSCHDLEGITEQNYVGYVKKFILNGNVPMWEGTMFAPILENLMEKVGAEKFAVMEKASSFIGSLFGKKPAPAPVQPGRENPIYAIIATDGDNFDESESKSLLESISSRGLPIYIEFVGIGNGTNFAFCKRMANKFDNVGFVHIPNPESIADEALYDSLINEEFAEWIKRFKK